MSEGVSKFAIAVEALVLLVPISILAFLMCVINLESILIGKSPTPDLLIVLPTVCLFCGWILVFRFFVYGSSALIYSPQWIWFGAICGGVATIAAFATTLGLNSLKNGTTRVLWRSGGRAACVSTVDSSIARTSAP